MNERALYSDECTSRANHSGLKLRLYLLFFEEVIRPNTGNATMRAFKSREPPKTYRTRQNIV